MDNNTGTIKLPTLSACALFDHEIQGQLSDGMWENAAPFDHWKFWCHLTVQFAPEAEPKVETTKPWACKKTGYNIAALYEYVGERMLKVGRMALAFQRAGQKTHLSYDSAHAAEYMPPTFEEWVALNKSGKWEHDFIAKYMEAVTPEVAALFYGTKYEMRDLRRDVAAIKTAMKSVRS